MTSEQPVAKPIAIQPPLKKSPKSGGGFWNTIYKLGILGVLATISIEVVQAVDYMRYDLRLDPQNKLAYVLDQSSGRVSIYDEEGALMNKSILSTRSYKTKKTRWTTGPRFTMTAVPPSTDSTSTGSSRNNGFVVVADAETGEVKIHRTDVPF